VTNNGLRMSSSKPADELGQSFVLRLGHSAVSSRDEMGITMQKSGTSIVRTCPFALEHGYSDAPYVMFRSAGSPIYLARDIDRRASIDIGVSAAQSLIVEFSSAGPYWFEVQRTLTLDA
jgi:hypothetical protein